MPVRKYKDAETAKLANLASGARSQARKQAFTLADRLVEASNNNQEIVELVAYYKALEVALVATRQQIDNLLFTYHIKTPSSIKKSPQTTKKEQRVGEYAKLEEQERERLALLRRPAAEPTVEPEYESGLSTSMEILNRTVVISDRDIP